MKARGLLRSRGIAAALALALAGQVPFARAAIVDTDALGSQSQVDQDRAKVQSFLDRADVKERIQAMGVSGLVAGGRVASLSDSEVHALAQRIDALPAGGNLSDQDIIIILLVAILVAVVV
ncbi:MAG: PA2779 family protein [Burkholderiales bacterium]|nr:PA2779 family protein [Burkholderiales bacterium]